MSVPGLYRQYFVHCNLSSYWIPYSALLLCRLIYKDKCFEITTPSNSILFYLLLLFFLAWQTIPVAQSVLWLEYGLDNRGIVVYWRRRQHIFLYKYNIGIPDTWQLFPYSTVRRQNNITRCMLHRTLYVVQCSVVRVAEIPVCLHAIGAPAV